MKKVIFGSPGTGKTTYLIKELEEEIKKKNLKADDICFCTYSRAAAEEIKERISKKFNFSKKEIFYFGTIHSICYRLCNIGKDILSGKDKQAFFLKKGINYIIPSDDEDLLSNDVEIEAEGNIILSFYDRIRLKKFKRAKDISDVEFKVFFFEENLENFQVLFNSFHNPLKIIREYEEYKKEINKIDYIDMLLDCYEKKIWINTKVLFVDEFQDLSPLQYQIIKIWEKEKEEVLFAGDDDQTIYSFICASPSFLLEEKEKANEVIILPETFRLPINIHLRSKLFIERYVKKRVRKDVISQKEPGIIKEINYKGLLKEIDYINERTFVLFRTNFLKKNFIETELINEGIPYFEVKGTSIWNERSIALFNGLKKISEKKPVLGIELQKIIENLDYEKGLLKRGLKTKVKENKDFVDKIALYSQNDMITLGINPTFFLIGFQNLINLFDLSEKTKKAFLSTKTKEINKINLHVGTIHSSKGKEADNVVVFLDTPKRVELYAKASQDNFESEARVFYVGFTRARKNLFLVVKTGNSMFLF